MTDILKPHQLKRLGVTRLDILLYTGKGRIPTTFFNLLCYGYFMVYVSIVNCLLNTYTTTLY